MLIKQVDGLIESRNSLGAGLFEIRASEELRLPVFLHFLEGFLDVVFLTSSLSDVLTDLVVLDHSHVDQLLEVEVFLANRRHFKANLLRDFSPMSLSHTVLAKEDS